jgi:predicted RNase H-like nuclease (RuvC/YqgF family)
MTINFETLLPLLGIIGGGTGVAAIIVAVSSRKKTKADATSIIQAAAAAQVQRTEAEAERWKRECFDLRTEVDVIKGRVDEQDACQTSLKVQLQALEKEKASLLVKVESLKKRVEDLEQENRRLKSMADIGVG